MFVEGSPNVVILDDGWTAVSDDQSRAAQFEHTVLITEAGCEILTWSRQTSVLFKLCLCRWIQSVKRFLCLYVFTFVRRSVGNHEDLMWLKINMTKELLVNIMTEMLLFFMLVSSVSNSFMSNLWLSLSVMIFLKPMGSGICCSKYFIPTISEHLPGLNIFWLLVDGELSMQIS